MVKKFKIIRKKRKTIKMVNFPMPSTAKKFKIKKKIIPKSVGRGTPPVKSVKKSRVLKVVAVLENQLRS